jgi:hypothetical protein
MLSKAALLAAALALSLPVYADNPSTPTQTIAKQPAFKSSSKSAPKSSSKSSGKSIPTFSGTMNGDGMMVDAVSMAMWKNGKNNNADQKKEAQAAGGSARKADKVRGNLTVIPPKK